jgi:kojibiose phosphorylase
VTGDDEFLIQYGAEIILDTAVFWDSRVEYNGEADQYEVSDIIGPDEWHEHVDNNVYTNRMIQYHLGLAGEVLDWLEEHGRGKGAELRQRLDLSPERLARWRDIEAKIKINYEPETGLMEQFDGYFDLQEVDMADYEPRRKAMYTLLHEEGIDPNDTKLLKQPDVIMLLCLLADAYDDRTRQANWDYYAPRTDHRYGSSLGPTFHTILACRLGMPEVAYEHFMRAASADLEDSRGNADEGIHGASCGGMWQAAVLGFAGLRVTPEGYRVEPRLPKHWKRLRFTFRQRGKPVEVVVENESA